MDRANERRGRGVVAGRRPGRSRKEEGDRKLDKVKVHPAESPPGTGTAKISEAAASEARAVQAAKDAANEIFARHQQVAPPPPPPPVAPVIVQSSGHPPPPHAAEVLRKGEGRDGGGFSENLSFARGCSFLFLLLLHDAILGFGVLYIESRGYLLQELGINDKEIDNVYKQLEINHYQTAALRSDVDRLQGSSAFANEVQYGGAHDVKALAFPSNVTKMAVEERGITINTVPGKNVTINGGGPVALSSGVSVALYESGSQRLGIASDVNITSAASGRVGIVAGSRGLSASTPGDVTLLSSGGHVVAEASTGFSIASGWGPLTFNSSSISQEAVALTAASGGLALSLGKSATIDVAEDVHVAVGNALALAAATTMRGTAQSIALKSTEEGLASIALSAESANGGIHMEAGANASIAVKSGSAGFSIDTTGNVLAKADLIELKGTSVSFGIDENTTSLFAVGRSKMESIGSGGIFTTTTGAMATVAESASLTGQSSVHLDVAATGGLLSLSSGGTARVSGNEKVALVAPTAEIEASAVLVTAPIVSLDGAVGIGESSPSHPLHLASGAHCTDGGVWVDASSRRLKDNIVPISSSVAHEALRELQPVSFTYKREAGKPYLGFIAEDVPDVVASAHRDGLSAMSIVAVLTKVLQEQQQQIEELRSQVQYLDELINKK